MLFNSYSFIFLFLPALLLIYFLAGRLGHNYALLILSFGSITFYMYSGAEYFFLLAGSVAWNFALANFIVHFTNEDRPDLARAALWLAVLGDLAVLGWYKYATFFGGLISGNLPDSLPLPPPGISFFTFTQIAFIVDLYRSRQIRIEPLRYVLFVTYFPHLIAGPLFHHDEMMRQFYDKRISRFSTRSLSVGLSIFVVGLFKKLFIADSLAPYTSGLFDVSHGAGGPSFLVAWGGTLAYTFQIYFDFSAYSDMAVGVSKMFNIKLPINFFSPYKATSVIDFWRRWHITLSRFLRDYLYIPLGGSRHGRPRHYLNLLVTMILGGLWHGAAMTFIVWGLIHGVALLANHVWRALCPARLPKLFGWGFTFGIVAVAWVFFRAHSSASAVGIISSLLGFNGVPTISDAGKMLAGSVTFPDAFYNLLPRSWSSFIGKNLNLRFAPVAIVTDELMEVVWILFSALICFFLPNASQIMRRSDAFIVPDKYQQVITSNTVFRLTTSWAIVLAFMSVIALTYMNRVSPFLYFQF